LALNKKGGKIYFLSFCHFISRAVWQTWENAGHAQPFPMTGG
jgi:hypothetical protein